MKRKPRVVHTARYAVHRKDGHVASYHRSYTLALKARRVLGRGARIVDREEAAESWRKARVRVLRKAKTPSRRSAR